MSRFIRARGVNHVGRPAPRRPQRVQGQDVGRWRSGFIRERIRNRHREEVEATQPASPVEPTSEAIPAEDVAGPFNKRHPRQVPPNQRPGWGPEMRVGPNMSLKAREGHRAAVIELRPGLFIVAEVPEPTLEGEFGAAGLLAPLIIQSATQALQNRHRSPAQAPSMPGEPQTVPVPQAPTVTAQILNAPATTALVNHAIQTSTQPQADPWAEVSGRIHHQPAYLLPPPQVPVVQPVYLPAPLVAPIQGLPAPWADAETVAGTLGHPSRRRC